MERVSRAYCCMSHSDSSRGRQSLDMLRVKSMNSGRERSGGSHHLQWRSHRDHRHGRRSHRKRKEEQSPFDPESCIPEHELIPRYETC